MKRQGIEKDIAVQKDMVRGYEPCILNIDGEISPSVTGSFKFWGDASPFRIWVPRKIISISAKVYGTDEVWCRSVADYSNYRTHEFAPLALHLIDESRLLRDFFKRFKEADLVVGHNVKKFDMKFLRTRAAFYNINPLDEPPQEDTLTIIKKYFALERNTLDYACKYFGIEGKTEQRYDDLIDGCIAGDMKKWATLKEYNIQDVVIDEKLYSKVAPWHTTHINLNRFRRSGKVSCKICGANGDRIVRKGLDRSAVKWNLQKYRCKDCGHLFRGREKLHKDSMEALMEK
jgi:hypothetical protein